MTRESTLARILDCGIVAVVRAPKPDGLVQAVRALIDGGVDCAEVTFTVPNAVEVIRSIRKELGDQVCLGAGTVMTVDNAALAIDAGVEFLVAPNTDLNVIRYAVSRQIPIMPGAFTPTEIVTAWQAGAEIVKLFPADTLGPGFLKAMRGPLPDVPLMPTGGIDLTNAAAFLKAGACCLGIGGNLVDPAKIAAGDFAGITDMARTYREIVRTARGS